MMVGTVLIVTVCIMLHSQARKHFHLLYCSFCVFGMFIHSLLLSSMVAPNLGFDDAYAEVVLYAQHLEIIGTGSVPSQTLRWTNKN
jgi:hypothetical protein